MKFSTKFYCRIVQESPIDWNLLSLLVLAKEIAKAINYRVLGIKILIYGLFRRVETSANFGYREIWW